MCLLLLVNKETTLAFVRTTVYIGGVNRTECWEKEAESGSRHDSPLRDKCRLGYFPISHHLMVLHRLLNMG